MMEFPLPLGHWYGVLDDVQSHTGRESINDEINLRQWQQWYMLNWSRELQVTGRFDGPSQRAAIAVQRSWRIPVTGKLDSDTWKATFEGPRPAESDEEPEEVGTPTPTLERALEGVVEGRRAKMARLATKAQASKAKSILWRHRTKGPCPEWFNPLDPQAQASVDKVRSLLGLGPGGWTKDLEERLTGLQKTTGLAPTGELDAPTAWVLDDLPAKPVAS